MAACIPTDGGATWSNKVLTALAPGWIQCGLAHAANATTTRRQRGGGRYAQRAIAGRRRQRWGPPTALPEHPSIQQLLPPARPIRQDGLCGDVDWRKRPTAARIACGIAGRSMHGSPPSRVSFGRGVREVRFWVRTYWEVDRLWARQEEAEIERRTIVANARRLTALCRRDS